MAGIADGSPIGNAAPYGQACTNCARAKCSCITGIEGRCERCHRLGKECIPVVSTRKRGSRPRRSARTGSRERLEERLNDIVSLLQVDQQRPGGSRPSLLGVGLNGPPAISPLHSAISIQCLRSEDENCMDIFRNGHLKLYPFIYLSPTVTARELQLDMPFLWMTIVASSTRFPAQQVSLSTTIRETLARRVIVENERNMDIFLGLLVYLTWSHNFNSGQPQLCMLSNMAYALATDLRINEIPAFIEDSHLGSSTPFSLPVVPQAGKVRPSEKRRALLAFYTATSIASIMLRFDPPHWSSSMDEAVQTLSNPRKIHDEEHGHPNDEILVSIARLVCIENEAARVARQTTREPHKYASEMFHIKALEILFDQTRASLSSAVLQNNLLLSFLYGTQILIYELALLPPNSSLVDQNVNLKRLGYLQACVCAAKHSLDNFLLFDSTQYTYLPISIMFHFGRSLQVLYWLSMPRHFGWDYLSVRSEVDILGYMTQIAARMDQAHESFKVQHGDAEHDVFSRAAEVLRKTTESWSQKFASMQDNLASCAGQAGDPDGSWPDLVNFQDEHWFMDIFHP
ncbi:hypothetical protein BX600DRAFT_478039 [Xylariales sp. PMI_506]|nr:hypothetical protein BX600DRAFT_478039 [Xylariales sp. PMI_506]